MIAGIRDGNRLPTVPNFQIAASASYNFPVERRRRRPISALVPACRQPLHPAERPGDNPRSLRLSASAFGGAIRRQRPRADGRRPEAARPTNYVNLSAGVDWDNGFGVMVYVNNLFDENALLSFDRERGGRARLGFNIGQPRVVGLTLQEALRRSAASLRATFAG